MKSLSDIFSGVDRVLNSAKHGNFEEVLTKTKNYAEQAGKKSADRIEISKKKVELLDSKTKLNKAYEAYGKLQFDAYSGESVNEEELQAKLQEIQLLKSRIDYLEAEIKEMHDAFMESLKHRDSEEDIETDAEFTEK